MARGGYRPNSGRKSMKDEEKALAIIRKAVKTVYGGEVEFVQHQLEQGEPSIIKFIMEHLFGKPKDKLDVTSDGQSIVWKETKTYINPDGANL